MPLADLLAPGLVAAAFAGGAFGASVGALQSFVLAGLFVVVGEVYALVGRTMGVVPAVDITGTVAFGVVLGPHVAFGGGAAAAAYAARKGYLDVDGPYPAKAIARGLGNRPDVLLVGGAFGVFGHWVGTLAGTYGVPTDPVALGVVVSALAHRLVFGYSIVGATTRLLDMSAAERTIADGSGASAGADGGRRVDPWLAYQSRPSHVLALGLVVGALGGYIAYRTGSAFLAFGLSVVAIAFLVAGAARIPVTHHMSLPASTAVLAAVGDPLGTVTPAAIAAAMPLWQAVVLGAAFGAIGGLLGELAQRVFFAHAETHLDPPAASIVLTSLCIGGLALMGVFPSAAWIPLP
jgi:hypothetical protein